MPDQAINEMMSAFASGCMDKENFIQFAGYIKDKGELPYKELGQLQTLVSMLPSILEPEKPAAELKSRVAKHLISIQDEIKEKIKAEREKTIEAERKKQTIVQGEKPDEFKFGLSAHQEPPPVQRMEVVKTEDLNRNLYPENQTKLFPENVKQTQEIPSQTPPWIAVVILFAAIAIFAYFSLSNYSQLKDELTQTENNLTLAKTEIRNLNEFINKNAALIEFFNNENVWVVPLTGVDPRLNVSGKLFIAANEREALLQINNLPTPSPDFVYQVWIISKNQSYSLGTFYVEPGNRFIKLLNIPVVPKEAITQFSISVEPRGGSLIPTGQVYATGDVSQITGNTRRRN